MTTATDLDLSPYALDRAESELSHADRSAPWRPTVTESRYLDWLRWCRDSGLGWPRPYEIRAKLGMTVAGQERALLRMERSDLIIRQRCGRNGYLIIAAVFGGRGSTERPAFLRTGGRPRKATGTTP